MFKKFGFSGSSDFFKELGDGVGKGLFILCAAIGTVLLTVGSAFAGSYTFSTDWGAASGFFSCAWLIIYNPNTALISGGALFLLGATGTYKDQDRQKQQMVELQTENEELNDTKSALNSNQEELQERQSRIIGLHGELVQTWLKGMSKFLGLDSNSRVTIYYEHAEEFYLLERYSKNPTYSKVHRQKFPLNQGVISRAWEHEHHVESNCPHSTKDDYVSYLSDAYGYEQEKIHSLTMKSCRYYAKAIIDADIHIGVIVFEGTETDFLDNELSKNIDSYCKDHQGQLSKFVRDSLLFDKEVNIKREGKTISVEDEFFQMMEAEE
ncbi:hypothetical protein [Shewanella waksmanii]|uniref:hypothetical protein n=1 Tax=Shewanella waksmanii TaxID=213783 RepID=UPI00048A5587|nr:hypothetical protein [Shewanella waksmanii]